MKRRYNKNNLKRKRRTKMRSKIRSKVYKRTKKKRLSKKNKRQQSAGGDAGESSSPAAEPEEEPEMDGQQWWQERLPLELKKGIKVLLKIGNKYKKCRILKIESGIRSYYLNFYVSKQVAPGRWVEEKKYEECKKIVKAEADSARTDDDDSSVKISDYTITPVSSCNRAVKSVWRLGQMRLEDDTGEGDSEVSAKVLLDHIKNAGRFQNKPIATTTVLQREDFGVSQSDSRAQDLGSYQ